jgi:hypothetical protein
MREKMKSKTLSQKEVEARVIKTTSEVFSRVLNISKQSATQILRTALETGVVRDRGELFRAAFLEQMNKTIESGVKRKGKRWTEPELDIALAKIIAFAPELATGLRKGLKQMQRDLPRRGGPGRETILSDIEKREAVKQIGTFLELGQLKKWPDIFEAVAELFRGKGKQISSRTIKRVWESRATLS